MSRQAVAVACACVLGSVSIAAQQDQPSPASSPVEQGLPPNNDVNDVNDGTAITDVGLVQIEIGSQWTHVDADSRSAGLPFTARYGAYEWLELTFGVDLLAQQSAAAEARGIGDIQVGGRLRGFGRPGGLPPLSVIPQLNLPTGNAASGLGTGHVDLSLALLTGRDFPHGSHVDVGYGAAAVGEGEGLGRFAQHAASVSASLGLTAAWTPALTLVWVSRQDADTGEAWILSADSVVTASRRLALDLSAQFGLNTEAPRFGVGGGMSFVFGELGTDEEVHARRHRLRFWPHRRPPSRR